MTNKISRKKFIQSTSLATAGVLLAPGDFAFSSNTLKIKAIAFDGFPIFDPRPVFKTVNELFPEKGKQLTDVWKSNQFGYQWLRVSANKYKNFWDVTKDALDFALAQCGLTLSDSDKDLIMNKYKTINTWPDVLPALQSLKKENLGLCILSNMTAEMLNRGIENSNTGNLFDYVISTDQKQTYKPSPVAYQMGIDTFKTQKGRNLVCCLCRMGYGRSEMVWVSNFLG
jgi:2-haloacid dehalogenase